MITLAWPAAPAPITFAMPPQFLINLIVAGALAYPTITFTRASPALYFG